MNIFCRNPQFAAAPNSSFTGRFLISSMPLALVKVKPQAGVFHPTRL